MNKLIKQAIETEKPRFSVRDYLGGAEALTTTSALLYLITYDYEHEGYSEKEAVRASIHDKFEFVLHKGMEPAFENSHCWGYGPLCESIALIKNKAELWDLFTEDEHVRLNQIMRMFLFMWNWGCNKYNNYTTGAGMHGNFHKASSPNYMLTNNLLIVFLVHYFHGNCYGKIFEEINEILNNVDYDTEMETLRRLGFYNAYAIWTTPAREGIDGRNTPSTKEIFENGGEIFLKKIQFEMPNMVRAGRGQGVKINVSYWDVKNQDAGLVPIPSGLLDQLFSDCFSGGAVASVVEIEDYDYTCKIKDDTISPYEGQEGMMKEFNIPFDGISRRSSLMHCAIDFMLVACAVATLRNLCEVDLTQKEYWNKIKVGMADFLYKNEHGYNGFSLGNRERATTVNLPLWAEYWNEKYN